MSSQRAGFFSVTLAFALRFAVTLWAVASLAFLLVRIAPGDPVEAIAGELASPEQRTALSAELGLDRPLAEQYMLFFESVFDGSLGQSFREPNRSVAEVIGSVLPDTAELALWALLFAWLVGPPLGLIAGARPNGWRDRAAMALANLGLAIPNLWLGPLLILLFAMRLQWLPLPGADHESALSLILPTLTLGSAMAAILARQMRASTLETKSQLFILAARARGISERAILFKHVFRNAVYPVLTIGAAQIASLLSGAVITEKIFEREGLGTLFLRSFFARDFPVIQGCILTFGVVFVLTYALLDVAQKWVDPRVRGGRG